jgi:hypothetical protein
VSIAGHPDPAATTTVEFRTILVAVKALAKAGITRDVIALALVDLQPARATQAAAIIRIQRLGEEVSGCAVGAIITAVTVIPRY